MALVNNNTRIETGVDADGKLIGIPLWEIMKCLGYYKRDTNGNRNLGTIIKNANINKMSLRKPVRSNSAEPITEEELITLKCGLNPRRVNLLLQSIIGNTSFVENSEDDCMSEIAEWTYNRPRGLATYNERFRILDFDGYNHKAKAPDGGWSQKDIDGNLLNELKSTTMNITNISPYDGYNIKVEPQYNGSAYNGGLYSSFSMLFGLASGESIGTITDMEIPIEYVASLDGCYRLALAVWIPNFGESGGWGIFASRMTIEQYFTEGGGTSLQYLLPDLATNPYVAYLMHEHVASEGGYATFNAVPLFVKNLGYNMMSINEKSLFCWCNRDGEAEAYCMVSGTREIPFICGEPPMTLWYRISYDSTSTSISGYIENTDEENSHTFGYTYTVYINGAAVSTGEGTITLSPLEKRQVAGAPLGGGLNVVVTSQDGIDI